MNEEKITGIIVPFIGAGKPAKALVPKKETWPLPPVLGM